MPMPSAKEMIEDIRSAEGCVNGIELSQWEEEFVESAEERAHGGRRLTTKQLDKLWQIWDRI